RQSLHQREKGRSACTHENSNRAARYCAALDSVLRAAGSLRMARFSQRRRASLRARLQRAQRRRKTRSRAPFLARNRARHQLGRFTAADSQILVRCRVGTSSLGGYPWLGPRTAALPDAFADGARAARNRLWRIELAPSQYAWIGLRLPLRVAGAV